MIAEIKNPEMKESDGCDLRSGVASQSHEEADAVNRAELYKTRDGVHLALMKIRLGQSALREIMDTLIRPGARCVNDADIQKWLLRNLDNHASGLVELAGFVKASITVEP